MVVISHIQAHQGLFKNSRTTNDTEKRSTHLESTLNIALERIIFEENRKKSLFIDISHFH